MNKIYHDSNNIKYRTPFGAVKQDEKIYLRIDTDREYKNCILRVWLPSNREQCFNMQFKNNNGELYYEIEVSFNELGIQWYCFIIQDYDYKLKYYACKDRYSAGEGQLIYDFPYNNSFQITCYSKHFVVPQWLKEGRIMYQIFPDRFARDYSYSYDRSFYKGIFHESFDEPLGFTQWGARNDEFYQGNLKGIINKLDYLKSLNVGIIYLNPINESLSNHRYDSYDYNSVAKMLGTPEQFKELCDKAHSMDIKVVVDISLNHTGDSCPYFQDALNNYNSPYRSWYYIHNDRSYDSWWGFSTLPVLNKYNNEYREYVKRIIRYWNDLHFDGFRLDVADELPDDFLEFLRREVKSVNPSLCLFGEVWDDVTLKMGYGKLRTYAYGNNQDGIMNYVLRNYIVEFLAPGYQEKDVQHKESLNAYDFVNKVNNILSNYPKEFLACSQNFLSTHDINRIYTVLANSELVFNMNKWEQGNYKLNQSQIDIGDKKFIMAWLIQLMMPGNPSLFYGDELGSSMTGYNDPFNRKPMNWNAAVNNSFLNKIRELNQLRNEEVLKTGEIKLEALSNDKLKITRYNDSNQISLIINRNLLTYEIIK